MDEDIDENDLAGVRKDSPAKQELGGGEQCLYYCCNILGALISAFLLCCGGIFFVEPMQAMIITAFGKVIRVETEQGLHF